MWKRRGIGILMCIIILFTINPMIVKADMGPKPSVIVNITGLSQQTCYATLLSAKSQSGPHSVYIPGETSIYQKDIPDHDIWQKFVDYKDPDNYYFLQQFWNCQKDNPLQWTYFPPDTFKVLIYFPESDKFVTTQIFERYAFHSYFTVHMDQLNISSVKSGEIVAMNTSYQNMWENISLAVRVFFTILLELLVAVLFHLNDRKKLLLIAIVNVITQLGLNVILNWLNFKNGTQGLFMDYILLEIVVTALEAVIYELCMPMLSNSEIPTRVVRVKAVKYAFVANIASFFVGFLIAKILPGFF